MMEHNQLGNLKPPLGEPEMAGPPQGVGDRNEGNGGATARKGACQGCLNGVKNASRRDERR